MIDYPVYNKNNVTIYQCDFRDVIGELSKDLLVVTDPPYNINFKYDEYKDNLSEDKYIDMINALTKFNRVIICQYPVQTMQYVVPALGVPDAVVAWCYNSNIPNRFRLISFYGCKPDYSREKQKYKNPTDKRVSKLIENGSDGTNLYEWWNDIQLVKNVSKEKTIHPCPVPERLQRRIINLVYRPNDIVFDPFAGCFTTLKMAKDLGLASIGCELSTEYIMEGIKRLE